MRTSCKGHAHRVSAGTRATHSSWVLHWWPSLASTASAAARSRAASPAAGAPLARGRHRQTCPAGAAAARPDYRDRSQGTSPAPDAFARVDDKRFLAPGQRAAVARRLRAAAPGTAVVKVYRYGIDDLRLFKALTGARLQGRVVVSDDVKGADVVLATRNKRLGRTADLAAARRAAANAGVPFVVLRAVSALRVAEALRPFTLAPPAESLRGWHANAGRELRRDAIELDGGDSLLHQLWHAEAQASRATQGWRGAGFGSSGPQAAHPGVCPGDVMAELTAAARAPLGGAAPPALEALLAAHAAAMADPFDWLAPAAVDVLDDRQRMEPANPTARLGARYAIARPIKHGSRLKRKRVRKVLREAGEVPW